MNRNDAWYLEVETMVDGERRGFSRQILARHDRHAVVPRAVDATAREFIGSVLDMSDVHTYASVLRGEGCDWPYRHATYVLFRNGNEVVRSFTLRPIRPDLGMRRS